METSLKIAVCKGSQPNITRANQLGYEMATLFMAGKTNQSTISWTGVQGNLSYNDTIHSIFNSGLHNIRSPFNNSHATKFFIPDGFCKVYDQPLSTTNSTQSGIAAQTEAVYADIRIGATEEFDEYNVYVFDPRGANCFQVPFNLQPGDRINLKAGVYIVHFDNPPLRLIFSPAYKDASPAIFFIT